MISYIPKARMLRTKRLRYRGNSRLFQAVRQLTACETEHVRMAWRLHCASACPALPWNMRRAVRKERCCTRSSLRNSKHSCEGSKTGIEPYRILSNRNFGLFWTVASWRGVFYVFGVKAAVTTASCRSRAKDESGVPLVRDDEWRIRQPTSSIGCFRWFPYGSGSCRCPFLFDTE